MNHGTERTSRVLAECLRFEVEQGRIIGRRRHLGFPWFQAPLGQNFGSYRGRGEGRGGVNEELPRKSEPYHRSVKASFKVDLPELKFSNFNFLSHVSEK